MMLGTMPIPIYRVLQYLVINIENILSVYKNKTRQVRKRYIGIV